MTSQTNRAAATPRPQEPSVLSAFAEAALIMMVGCPAVLFVLASAAS